MFRFKSEATARQCAAERGLYFGFCIFDGRSYVGTREQLARLSALYVTDPFVWDGAF